MEDAVRHAIVFIGMFSLDFVWAIYTKAIADSRIVSASVSAVVIVLLSGLVITSYVEDPWLLVPAGVAAFAGTAASIYCKKRGWI